MLKYGNGYKIVTFSDNMPSGPGQGFVKNLRGY